VDFFAVFGLWNILWLSNHKMHDLMHVSFDALVSEIRKTPILPNIRGDTIISPVDLNQGSMNYAE
jgi:hypothetical protein